MSITPHIITTISLSIMALLMLYLLRRRQMAFTRVASENRHLQQKLEMINSDLHPHFIYNVMSAIQHLFVQGEHKSAIKNNRRLADYMRFAFQTDPDRMVDTHELSEIINNYLKLESLRFEKQYRFEINVPEELSGEIIKFPAHNILYYVGEIVNDRLRHSTRECVQIEMKLFLRNNTLFAQILDIVPVEVEETINGHRKNKRHNFGINAHSLWSFERRYAQDGIYSMAKFKI